MGIDIQSLKNKEQNNISNVNSFVAYFIETQEFEDKLSNYVKYELDSGRNTFQLCVGLQEISGAISNVTLKFDLQDSNKRSIAKTINEDEDKINCYEFIKLLAEKTCNKLEELGFLIVREPDFINFGTDSRYRSEVGYVIGFKLK